MSTEAPLGGPEEDSGPEQLAGRDRLLDFIERMGVPTPGLDTEVEEPALGEPDLDP